MATFPYPPIEIPLPLDTPLFTMRTTLDGTEYLFELDYCEREFRWYLSIFDTSGNALATGVKLIADWPLLHQYVNPALPKGILMSVDDSPQGGEPPDFQALGRRVKLYYYPAKAPA